MPDINEKSLSFGQNKKKEMKETFLIFLTFVRWSNGLFDPEPVIPDNLLKYQNVTRINDSAVLKILNGSLQGE